MKKQLESILLRVFLLRYLHFILMYTAVWGSTLDLLNVRLLTYHKSTLCDQEETINMSSSCAWYIFIAHFSSQDRHTLGQTDNIITHMSSPDHWGSTKEKQKWTRQWFTLPAVLIITREFLKCKISRSLKF